MWQGRPAPAGRCWNRAHAPVALAVDDSHHMSARRPLHARRVSCKCGKPAVLLVEDLSSMHKDGQEGGLHAGVMGPQLQCHRCQWAGPGSMDRLHLQRCKRGACQVSFSRSLGSRTSPALSMLHGWQSWCPYGSRGWCVLGAAGLHGPCCSAHHHQANVVKQLSTCSALLCNVGQALQVSLLRMRPTSCGLCIWC